MVTRMQLQMCHGDTHLKLAKSNCITVMVPAGQWQSLHALSQRC